MMKFILVGLLTLVSLSCYSQNDTVVVKNQKGFFFLSSYHYLYDYDGGHTRPLGFHDFFYPVKDFNMDLLKDSNVNFIFKNGIRVNSINGRFGLKTQSLSVNCIDTGQCYEYKNFYVIPVVIDYKYYDDNWPLTCHQNFFELQVINGSRLRFENLRKALVPMKIVVQTIKRKSGLTKGNVSN